MIIHNVHRQMARLLFHMRDEHGAIVMGMPEIRLLIPLLRKNLELVQRFDELSNLALEAQVSGDQEWVQEITTRIEEMVLSEKIDGIGG